MNEDKPDKEKRDKQFNLMLKDSEQELLNESAEKGGYANKSDYIRELIRKDAELREMGSDEASVRKHLAESRQMLNKLNRSIRLFLVTFLIILFIIILGFGFMLFVFK